VSAIRAVVGAARAKRQATTATPKRRGATATASSFLPVRVTAAGPAAVEIERNGTTIRLHGEVDVESIASVLEALERTKC
jgi:hypothetical protein